MLPKVTRTIFQFGISRENNCLASTLGAPLIPPCASLAIIYIATFGENIARGRAEESTRGGNDGAAQRPVN